MALPVQSIRALPEHRGILQAVADQLRQGRAAELRRLLKDLPARPVGPFRSEAAAIAFLRDRLVSSLKPRAIWLFGSRACDDAGPDSDFDLLVVLPDGLPDAAYSHEAVAAPLVACGLGYDVVPCRWADYRAERELPGSLVHRAVSEGRLLYQDRATRNDRRRAA